GHPTPGGVGGARQGRQGRKGTHVPRVPFEKMQRDTFRESRPFASLFGQRVPARSGGAVTAQAPRHFRPGTSLSTAPLAGQGVFLPSGGLLPEHDNVPFANISLSSLNASFALDSGTVAACPRHCSGRDSAHLEGWH